MLMQLLYEQAQQRPDHTAIVYGEQRIAFADLVERVERLASGLARRGVSPGQAVALVLRDDPWFVACFHAITAMGAIVVPVSPAFKQAELEFYFRSAGVAAIISDERATGVCERIAAGLSGEVSVISTAPMYHTYAMGATVFAGAVSGATIVILEDPQPFLLRRRHVLELLERERVTVLPGVPFNFRLMAEAPAKADLSAVRLCFSAGTAMPRETFEAFGERFGVLVRQLYGSTETGMIAANLSDDPVDTFSSVGRPLPGVNVEIVDDDGAELPAGELGEVVVASPAVSDGYADADEASQAAFEDGRYFTGDLGRLDEQGLLYLEGRKKLLIEVGGYKIDPVEVQDVLCAHPCVSEAIVVGVEGDVQGEETVKAVVVPSDDCGEAELISFCRERLANFKVPRVVEFRDEIPKSAVGKVLRKYLV